MSRWPLLEEMLGPQLDGMESILRQGRAGKHANEPGIRVDGEYQFNKADSHIFRAGPTYSARDTEEGGTGEPHILHAAVRLLMANHATEQGWKPEE